MKITENFEVIMKKNGSVVVVMEGSAARVATDQTEIEALTLLYTEARSCPEENRAEVYNTLVASGRIPDFLGINEDNLNEDLTPEEAVMKGLNSIMNFFTEFEFEPNFRFINSIGLRAKDADAVKNYIKNYFKLVDNSYAKEVAAKMESQEFARILRLLEKAEPQNVINQRFKVYYGSAGTGKTTRAQEESNGKCIVCNNTMLPSDIMEDFVFENGQPSFKKSELWNAMEAGVPIVLDEINLLPFDSLRFLQGILDGKKQFDYKGHTVTINEGFMVIGTMNLTIGGMVFGLPEPLVDRAMDFQEFKLTAEALKAALD